MKKYILIILILLSPLPVFLQADNLTSPFNSIVPRPAQITPGSGSFIFSAKTTFAVENQEQATIAHNFIDLFVHAAGITPMLNVGSKEGQVLFVTDSSLKTEAYLLKVTPEQILIKASDTIYPPTSACCHRIGTTGKECRVECSGSDNSG